MDVLLGLQWGDEGKGKVVDFLAPKYDIVVRFQGGPNAGHTLEFDGKKVVLHQIPSGIFRPNIQNVISNGVVLDPITLQREIENVEKLGAVVANNLFISKKTHLILPTHRLLDAASEKKKGDQKIGSTLKGIGPAYQDKTGRSGLRVGDIFTDNFKERYDALVAKHKDMLSYLAFDYELEAEEEAFFAALEIIKKLRVIDSEYFLNNARKEGKTILAEGAQGSLLDVDFGSYPYVTSSNTFTAGACTGTGVPPSAINSVFGIFKAYCTRVGNGPFPTELFDEAGEELRKVGHEFGATTGRPRRCGWLDLPALKYSVMINGVTELFMMKSDVLNNFEEILVCTHYIDENDQETEILPFDMNKTLKPQLKAFGGWQTEITNSMEFDTLPSQLLDYIAFIEKEVGVSITLVSYGPDRKETIHRNEKAALV
ncbi:MAG: adenylosuccinate synthase [Flammeovirgaceae bacterium]